jgi:hypothetical protein
MAFKSFSEKSKAKRGLLAFAKRELGIELSDARIAEVLHMSGDPMKWGFDDTFNAPAQAEPLGNNGDNVERIMHDGEPIVPGDPLADGALTDTDHPMDDEPEGPVASGNMFAGIGATLGAVATNPTPAATRSAPAARTAYNIEKNRPEQNGIKRPSAGGLCRAVWDAMDAQRETNAGDTPTTQQVRDLALMFNWNINNAMIEYYQWRKYNGITGRAAKKVEAPAVPATV